MGRVRQQNLRHPHGLDFLQKVRQEELTRKPDLRYQFTLESAEQILKLADQGLVQDKFTLTLAAQVVREAAMTGLEKVKWTTIAFNTKEQQWEVLDKGDWSKYKPKYMKPRKIK